MPHMHIGIMMCEKCIRSVRVMWPTINTPLDAVRPMESSESLSGWRFVYVPHEWGVRLTGDAEVFCPDHAADAPPNAQVHS